MMLFTERLILRPWQLSDAEDLYYFAKDPRIGPIAGWPAHQSVEESTEIIRSIFMQDHIFAVVLKDTQQVIGCIGLQLGANSYLAMTEQEGELSYWIGVPYWGKGLIPEAAREIIRHAFQDLKLDQLWSGYIDGNANSRIVQEKCGFRHHHTLAAQDFELINQQHDQQVSHLSHTHWLAMQTA